MSDTIYWDRKAGDLVNAILLLGGECIELSPDGDKTLVTFHMKGLFQRKSELEEDCDGL
jgi:hypothetical protein